MRLPFLFNRPGTPPSGEDARIIVKGKVQALVIGLAVVALLAPLYGGLALLYGGLAPLHGGVGAQDNSPSAGHDGELSPALTPSAHLSSPAITFGDESTAWDWQVTCQEPLRRWMEGLPFVVSAVQITLTDEARPGPASVGVAYPSLCTGTASPCSSALAYAECSPHGSALACQVQIAGGEPGADLDVAVTAAIPHAIRQAWLVRAPDGAEQIAAQRHAWSWEQFKPLLTEEPPAGSREPITGSGEPITGSREQRWYSSCLTVSRP